MNNSIKDEVINDDKTNDEKTNTPTNGSANDNIINESVNDKPLNQIFRDNRKLYKFDNIKSFPSNCIMKMKTFNESCKRTFSYWLTLNYSILKIHQSRFITFISN